MFALVGNMAEKKGAVGIATAAAAHLHLLPLLPYPPMGVAGLVVGSGERTG
jgi:hypothetical protein